MENHPPSPLSKEIRTAHGEPVKKGRSTTVKFNNANLKPLDSIQVAKVTSTLIVSKATNVTVAEISK